MSVRMTRMPNNKQHGTRQAPVADCRGALPLCHREGSSLQNLQQARASRQRPNADTTSRRPPPPSSSVSAIGGSLSSREASHPSIPTSLTKRHRNGDDDHRTYVLAGSRNGVPPHHFFFMLVSASASDSAGRWGASPSIKPRGASRTHAHAPMHAEATMPPPVRRFAQRLRVLHDDKSASQTRDKTHQRDGVERLPEVRAARTSLSADSPRTTWESSQTRCSNDGCMHKDEAVARPQCQTQFPIARQRYVVVVLGSPVQAQFADGPCYCLRFLCGWPSFHTPPR